MVIWRTTLATLVLVAMAGLAFGQSHQKKDPGCDHGCGKGKDECPKGCGLKNCCGETACCDKSCGVTTYMKNCYSCVCTSVCLPTRPCCPLKDPSCCCDKGKGCCDPKGGCGHDKDGCCDKDGKGGCCGKDCCGKDQKGPNCCTKNGPCCKIAGKVGSKGCGCKGDGKGCDDPKGTCDPKDGKGHGCNGKCGLMGKLFPDCCSCQPRVKKHLMIRQVVACEDPGMKCGVVKDPGCNGKDGGEKVPTPAEGGPEPAADVPPPPPVKIGTTVRNIVPVSYTSTKALGTMFK